MAKYSDYFKSFKKYSANANPRKVAFALSNKDQNEEDSTGSTYTPLSYAPPPREPTPYLPDSLYQQQVGLSEAKLNDALSGALNDENQLATNYGVSYDKDASGGVSNAYIDSNVEKINPFSKAAMMKDSFKKAERGTVNSYSGRGLFGSGAYEEARKRNTFNMESDRNALLNAFRQGAGAIQQRRVDAQRAAAEAKLAAEQELLARMLEERRMNEAAVAQSAMQEDQAPTPVTNEQLKSFIASNIQNESSPQYGFINQVRSRRRKKK